MIKTLSFGASLLVALLMLPGCGPSQQSLQERGLNPLTYSELETLFSRRRTTRWTSAKGVNGAGAYDVGGAAKLNWYKGEAVGSWRIVGDTFCTKYPKLHRGSETCFTFYKTGGNEYQLYLPDGAFNATVVFSN